MMEIEKNPLKCKGCCKCVEAEDFQNVQILLMDMNGYINVLDGEIYTDEHGNITTWTCEDCVRETK